MKTKDYAAKYNASYDRIKAITPNVIIIANGDMWENGEKYFFDTLMKYSGDKIDIYSYHPSKGCPKWDITLEKVYLQNVDDCYEYYIKKEMRSKIKQGNYKCSISSNKWWTMFNIMDGNWDLLDNIIVSAIWSAMFINSLYRNSDIISFTARTIGIGGVRMELDTKGSKAIFMSPVLKAMTLLNDHKGNYSVGYNFTCDTFELMDEYPPYWIVPTPYIDVTSTISDDSLFLYVINRHPTQRITSNIEILGSEITNNCVREYSITSANFYVYDTPDDQNVIKKNENIISLNNLHIADDNTYFNYTFPKHSITILTLSGKFDSISSIDEFVKIYQNPSDNWFEIYLTKKDILVKNIKIIDNTGKKVYDKDINSDENPMTIRNTNLSKGSYQFIIEFSNDETINKNIVVD
jgi:hypothetical protein